LQGSACFILVFDSNIILESYRYGDHRRVHLGDDFREPNRLRCGGRLDLGTADAITLA
jgi:hypothetical protein